MKYKAWYLVFFITALCWLPASSHATTNTVTVTDVTHSSVSLSWAKVDGAERYQVTVTNVETGRVVYRAVTKKNQRTVRQLKDDIEYSFKVKPFIQNKFKKKYFEASATHTLLNFTPTAYVLQDTFEQTTLGETYLDYQIQYVAGQAGYGFTDVYSTNSEGVQIRANILSYDNTDEQLLNTDVGTVELWVSPTSDPALDTESHGLLDAWSAGRLNNWGILVYQNTLIVTRDFGPCIRQSFQTPYIFTPGQWYKLTLTWRGTETEFYINDEPIGEFTTSGRSVYTSGVSGIVSVGDDLFITDTLSIAQESPIPVRDLEPTLSDVVCPDFDGLLEQNIQETYHDIVLHNFTDQATRDAVKSVLDLLPETYAGETKHIVVVDDETYDLWMHRPTILGHYSFPLHSIFLRASVFATPELVQAHTDTLFHEFGHGHIYAENLGYGGPTSGKKRTEWVNISGISAYVGECANPTEVLLDKGFLTAYASTMPDEDLAEWVGIALDLYAKNSTFSDLLNPSSEKYSSLYQTKVDYLLAHEFISQEIYDSITATTENSTYYTDYND